MQRKERALLVLALLVQTGLVWSSRDESQVCPLLMEQTNGDGGHTCTFPKVAVPAAAKIQCNEYRKVFPTTLNEQFNAVVIKIDTADRDRAGGFKCPQSISQLKKMADGSDACSFRITAPSSTHGIAEIKPLCKVSGGKLELGYTFKDLASTEHVVKNDSPYGWEGCENTILDRQLERKVPPGCEAPGALLVGFQLDDKSDMQSMNEFQCCNVIGNLRHYANCYMENVKNSDAAALAGPGDPVPLTCSRKGYYVANFYLVNDQIQCCRVAEMPISWYQCETTSADEPWTKCEKEGYFVRSMEVTHSQGDRIIGKGSSLNSVECCGVCPISCKNAGTLKKDECECNCPDPWSGLTCETCTRTCQNGGMIDEGSCTCDCPDNWMGDSCETCGIRCRNGGSKTSDCKCACKDPWTGPNCDDCPIDCGKGQVAPTTCTCDCPEPWSGVGCRDCTIKCANGGTVKASDCTCKCAGNWSGPTCNECDVTCANGGVLDKKECKCKCQNSWSGLTCQDCNIRCRHDGYVENSPASCKCNCEGTWEGKKCDECALECKNGSKLDKELCICKCNDAWKGKECNDCTDECMHDGTMQRDTCQCDCKGAWEGSRCERCGLSCVHGKLDATKCECLCDHPWTGTECDECGIETCKHGGTLDQKQCQCKCPAPYTGKECDECPKTKCQNGGQMDPDSCTCKCLPNWEGNQCEECALQCMHGGTNLMPGSCACNCKAPWGGQACEACNLTCRNGGTLDAKYCMCNCQAPWLGEDCNQCTLQCRNGGVLDKKSCTCKCAKPWSGDECQACQLVCMHGGVRNSDSCLCNCQNPWTSSDCSVCPLVCRNGGVLNKDTCSCGCVPPWSGDECAECLLDCGDFGVRDSVQCKCVCKLGFSGSDCSSCKLKCKHGKIDKSKGCRCKCDPNWGGKLCDKCDASQCKNGSVMDHSTCTCKCKESWSGIDCGKCQLNCKNGGRMTFYHGCKSCLCKPGYTGKECEKEEKVVPVGAKTSDMTKVSKLVPLRWGYDEKTTIGPSRWEVVGTLCKHGRHQSPIAISSVAAVEDASLSDLGIFYNASRAEAMFTGWTVQVNFGGAGDKDTCCEPGSLVIGAFSYNLVNIHFHWPSEHTIDGKAADMEIHLVHEGVGDSSSRAIVSIPLQVGDPNPEMEKFFSYIRPDGRSIPGLSIDPTELLPENLDYYMYDGSISTPPCVENVQNIVLKNPGSVSQSDLDHARLLMSGGNARPLQPLNHRKIKQHSHRNHKTKRKLGRVMHKRKLHVSGDFALVPPQSDAPPPVDKTPAPKSSTWPLEYGMDDQDCSLVPC